MARKRQNLGSAGPVPASGYYLVKVAPETSTTDDLANTVKRGGPVGVHRFSSLNAARLAAIVARERERTSISLNMALHPVEYIRETQILEHPDGRGGFVNFANLGWMTDTLSLPSGNLGIGVVKPWDSFDTTVSFGAAAWRRPRIAIIDGGFALRYGNRCTAQRKPRF